MKRRYVLFLAAVLGLALFAAPSGVTGDLLAVGLYDADGCAKQVFRTEVYGSEFRKGWPGFVLQNSV